MPLTAELLSSRGYPRHNDNTMSYEHITSYREEESGCFRITKKNMAQKRIWHKKEYSTLKNIQFSIPHIYVLRTPLEKK